MVARSVRVNTILDKFRGTPEDWNADVAAGIAAGSPPSLGAVGRAFKSSPWKLLDTARAVFSGLARSLLSLMSDTTLLSW
jgi:hypothetical protein